MSRINFNAVLVGSGAALVLIVPVVVVARLLVGDDEVSSSWQLAFALYVLSATIVGTGIGARREPDTPLMHGALAGLMTFVVAQVVSSAVRAEAPNLFAVVFFGVAFMCLGAIGGFVATAIADRRGSRTEEGRP